MNTEVGEYLVGAYLKVVKGVDIVDYNAKPPGGGLEGLSEMDVIGLDLKRSVAYLCEVTTHTQGILYGDYDRTKQKLEAKYKRQQEYAEKYLGSFARKEFMFWSPVVPNGKLLDRMRGIQGWQIIVNEDYAERFDELYAKATEMSHDTGNPVFRLLQIMARLRRSPNAKVGEGSLDT